MTPGKICPHCGAALPSEAAFCPHCAHSLTRRKTFTPPRYRSHQQRQRVRLAVLLPLAAVAAALLIGLGLYLYRAAQPKTYEGVGTLTYTDQDGTYELILGDNRGPDVPLPEMTLYSVPGKSYEKSFHLYVFHADTGANAAGILMSDKMNWCEVLVRPDNPNISRITCGNQDGAIWGPWGFSIRCSFQWNTDCGDADVVWNLHMKNGDTIHLWHRLNVEPVDVYVYTPDDLPMGTMEELQATVDQLAEEAEPTDILELHLPPVTYEGTLNVHGPTFRLYGAEQDGVCTTFEGGVHLDSWGSDSTELACLNLTGPGTGLVVNGPAKVSDCTFTGFDTAVRCSDSDFLQMYRCDLTGNDVGFHLTPMPQGVNYLLEQCRLEDNGTGVVLDGSTPEIEVNLQQSTFLHNGINVDNRCGQSVNMSTSTIS